ncbi:MAG: hypothetical protein MZV70_57250 [Desulfobacterales bacterium]|nr:hypothetical protein [Desulfobacterales bacterium]
MADVFMVSSASDFGMSLWIDEDPGPRPCRGAFPGASGSCQESGSHHSSR